MSDTSPDSSFIHHHTGGDEEEDTFLVVNKNSKTSTVDQSIFFLTFNQDVNNNHDVENNSSSPNHKTELTEKNHDSNYDIGDQNFSAVV